MKITICEPATSLQQINIEGIELDETYILRTIIELLELQYDYYQTHVYYAKDCRELIAFDKIRKE